MHFVDHFISVDIGTTAIKLSLIDGTGTVKRFIRREYELETPATDIVEMDAVRYRQYTQEGIGRLVRESGIPKDRIISIAVSSQGETLIAVDQKGNPLRKAIVWLDNRSRVECEELREAFGLIRGTGQNEVIPTWPATRLLWLRKNEPELFRATHKFLLLEDYLLFHLTGEFIGELSLYSSSYMVDIVKRDWIPKVLDFIGVRRDQLVALHEPGTVIGKLNRRVCDELSLSPKTLVVAGAMDQAASVVGAGGITEDVTVETTGTVLSVCRTLDSFDEKAHRGHPVHYHAVAGKYHSIDWCPTGGKSLGWLRDVLTDERAGARAFEDLTAPTTEIPPGSDGLMFFPFLSGLGTFGPVSKTHGAFFDIEIHHTGTHFVKSVLESVAFLIRRSIESSGSEIEPEEIRSLGGGAASAVWNQIKADVTGKTIVTLESHESSSLGIAMVQAVACGVYPTFDEAAAMMVRVGRSFEPDSSRHERYRELYTRYWTTLESVYFP